MWNGVSGDTFGAHFGGIQIERYKTHNSAEGYSGVFPPLRLEGAWLSFTGTG